jgi:integrase
VPGDDLRFSKLKWSDVDLKRKHAFIGSSTSKSKPIAVPLNNAAVAAIRSQLGKHPVSSLGRVDSAGRALRRQAADALMDFAQRAR